MTEHEEEYAVTQLPLVVGINTTSPVHITHSGPSLRSCSKISVAPQHNKPQKQMTAIERNHNRHRSLQIGAQEGGNKPQ